MRQFRLSKHPLFRVAGIQLLGTVYEEAEEFYDQLLEDHGELPVFMDDDGNLLKVGDNCQMVPLDVEGDEPEDEEPEPVAVATKSIREGKHPAPLPYVKKGGMYICLAEGCDKKLKTEKGMKAHCEKVHG
jgi:hypothetical protein